MTQPVYPASIIHLSILLTALVFTTIFSQSLSAQDGPALFKENCESCHGTKARGPDRLAPPMVAVKNHYLSEHQGEGEFVAAIENWLKKPDQGKTLMPGAIQKFGVMPPLELETAERQTLAKYIYDTDFQMPGWRIQSARPCPGAPTPRPYFVSARW